MSFSKLLLMFLKIGATSFGGYMALVSHVQDNVVEKKKWLSREEFMEGVTLAQMLPGATGINVVTYVGQKLKGTAGGILSLIAVVVPSFVLMVILSELYLRFRYLPQIEVFLAAVNPAVIALIVVVAIRLGQQSIKSVRDFVMLLTGILVIVFLKGNFAIGIFLIGFIGVLVYRSEYKNLPLSEGGQAAGQLGTVTGQPENKTGPKNNGDNSGKLMAMLPLFGFFVFSPEILAQLFVLFFKIGAVIFGGGYVMIPVIQKEMVDVHQLVTRREFVDGLAMGQATPGPIVITAAFIGYKVAGLAGAAAAITGIFMPSTILVLILSRYLPVIKRFAFARAFLKGIQAAIAGLLIYVAFNLGKTVISDFTGVVLLLTAFLLMLWNKIDNAFIILGLGLVGLVVHFLVA